MTDIAYYVDEHIAGSVVSGRRRRSIDALTTHEAGLRGASDKDQLSFAAEEERVMVTKDDDFLRLHAAGFQHSGIVFVSDRTSIGAIVRGLVLIYQILDREGMQNHVEFL